MNQQLIEDNLKLVYGVVNKYYPTFATDEDIIQCGMVGLCKAADTWDESKSKFSTFACRCIQNEMRMEFRRRKKYSGTYSLDYEVSDGEGGTTTLGDFIEGEPDVECTDWKSVYEQLTPVERKCLDLARQGLTQGEISTEIGYSQPFVAKHLRKVKRLIKNYSI